MTITLTLEQIMLLFLFLLGAAVGIYLVIVLKNVNKLIVQADKTIRRNEDNITGLLSHLEKLSKDTAGLSEEVKKQFVKYESVAGSILRTGSESMLMISDTTDRVRSITSNINEMIKTITRLVKK
ncbi:MAG: hypothetical protein SCH71_04360 [Desulfobulbaceae bacterium]|nr:hypothetical protein [Desulfobulbaceae bacterium]